MAVTSSGTATLTLPADDQLLITREFNAPKHLIYKAWTTPALVKRWFHGNRGQMKACENDVRAGGFWRYVMVLEGGYEVTVGGDYREIVPNERIVQTEYYDGRPGDEMIDTVTFKEENGRTTLQILVQLATKERRDAFISPGMEEGLQDGLDLLELVAVSRYTADLFADRTTKTYPVTVNYGSSLAEMITAGNYDSVNDDIRAENFPVEGSGSQEREIRVLHFGRYLTSDDAIGELAQQGLRPAKLEELLAFGEHHPDEQREAPIAALGSVWRGPSGDRFAPVLWGGAASRDVNLDWFEHVWQGGLRFAAVDK